MRTCGEPGCPVLVERGKCATHGGTVHKWDQRRPDVQRLRGRASQARRQRVFARDEYQCVLCKAEGIVTLATIADHVIPLAEGGPDTEDNMQSVCTDHSNAKTQAEARRGRNAMARDVFDPQGGHSKF